MVETHAAPRGAKRERTRTRLLDAALELTREKGFDQTTLQEIAQRAGVTTGAIYGNFANRDALFVALAERQWASLRPAHQPGQSFADLMDSTAEALLAAMEERAPAAVGALTFRAYALRTPQVRRGFHEAMARGYAAGAAWLDANFRPEELPMSAAVLVRVINALAEGLTEQRLLTPELITDEVVRAAFRALAPSASGDLAAPPQGGV